MKDSRFVVGENVVPLLAPADQTSSAWATPWVDLKNALHATFKAFFGSLTSTPADEYVTVTKEVSATAASSGEVAIPFKYRLSAAVGANSWGAITAVANTGVNILTATNDNMMLAVDVDPAALEASLTAGRFVRMVGTPSASVTADLVSVEAVLDPRYPQLSHLSAS